jgi:hypothetical protein
MLADEHPFLSLAIVNCKIANAISSRSVQRAITQLIYYQKRIFNDVGVVGNPWSGDLLTTIIRVYLGYDRSRERTYRQFTTRKLAYLPLIIAVFLCGEKYGTLGRAGSNGSYLAKGGR